MPKAFISGCKGVVVTPEELAFFEKEQPWGFIVFGRNIETPAQLKKLVQSLKESVAHKDVPVLIDQEGGRVQRMKQPHWRRYAATGYIGKVWQNNKQEGLRAAWLQGRLLASDLDAVGINVDCAPVLDVPVSGSDDVTLGDRTYGDTPEPIFTLADKTCDGLLAGGVAPIVKHMPGLGRANLDSHYELPVVDVERSILEETDFQPFVKLSAQKMAMTAHIIYSKIDADNPATQSARVVSKIIRDHIGFDGLLMSDDVSMKALKGNFGERCEKTFSAGCDVVLHCNGDMEEMKAVAASCPKLTGKSLDRATKAMEAVGNVDDNDISSLHAEYDELLSKVNWPPATA